MDNIKELSLEAKIENVEKIIAFVDEYLESFGCPMKAQYQLDVVVDDLFANVASYAYPKTTGDMAIRIEKMTNGVKITRMDWGVPFNPLTVKDPDTTLSIEERKIGGLGTFLVKNLCDSLDYEYKDNCNIVTITKKF